MVSVSNQTNLCFGPFVALPIIAMATLKAQLSIAPLAEFFENMFISALE